MFIIETHYDQKAMTAMGRALRKTIRKKHAKRSRFFGIFTVVLGVLLLLASGFSGGRSILTAVAVLAIVFALIFEDSLNGYIAQKRGLPGMEHAVTTFHNDSYHTVTNMVESTFFYTNILRFVRCRDYYIFVFGPSHGQVYDAKTLTGGSEESFVAFIEEQSGKTLETIK